LRNKRANYEKTQWEQAKKEHLRHLLIMTRFPESYKTAVRKSLQPEETRVSSKTPISGKGTRAGTSGAGSAAPTDVVVESLADFETTYAKIGVAKETEELDASAETPSEMSAFTGEMFPVSRGFNMVV
jgi:hypothetical protein